MSNTVFPTLIGLGYPVVRTPTWSSTLQQAISGFETRWANYTFPRYLWSVDINVLQAQTTTSDFQRFIGFFNQRQGQFDTFLYQDADDYSVTGQTIGVGDGSTQAFQLVRTFGGNTEPVLAPNSVTNIKNNGVAIPAITAPTNGSLTQTAAGALAATVYYVRCTWQTAAGETIASSETSLSVSANNVLNVAAPSSPPAGVTGWNVYVSNTAGGGANTEKKQNTTLLTLGTAWVEPTSGLTTTGASYPIVDMGSGVSYASWGSTTPGILTIAPAPAAAHVISADLTYYWPCRMNTDTIDFSLAYNDLYQAKKVSFMSVKN